MTVISEFNKNYTVASVEAYANGYRVGTVTYIINARKISGYNDTPLQTEVYWQFGFRGLETSEGFEDRLRIGNYHFIYQGGLNQSYDAEFRWGDTLTTSEIYGRSGTYHSMSPGLSTTSYNDIYYDKNGDGVKEHYTDEDGEYMYFYHCLDGTHTYKYHFKFFTREEAGVSGNIYTLTDKDGNPLEFSGEVELPTYTPCHVQLLTAPNFSDEENPTITYPTVNYTLPESGRYKDIVDRAYAYISFDGENEDIIRDISEGTNSLTFNFTDEERQKLRLAVTDGISKQVVFGIKTLSTQTYRKVADTRLTKTFTLVGAYPTATLTVEDVDPKTLALTGDKNTIVKYYSDASYVLNTTASKGATIVSEQVECGNKISTTETGVLENVESNIFMFGAVDSRNNGVAGTLTKGFVDYVKLTCQQKIEIDLSGAASTGAAATAKIEGNYWRGNFGLTDNSLIVQIRHTQNDGSMGDWVTLTDFVEVYYNGNNYSLEFGISGLDYAKPYTFQCRAIDKLNTATTAEYTTRVMPVFDWSGEDFSFNVPVNITADVLNIQDNTVLRHTGANTVLSGNNGNIYIRPGGTDDTGNETIFYGNGNIKFGGTVDLGESFTIGGDPLNDFVIDSGTEAMGSNGTWYWRKWASGKAECWGCRNFGNMGISTAFGSLYRGAINSQNLPSNLFKTTPDVINIQMLNGGNGCWIAKWNDVAPSAVTSGSFVVINAVSSSVSPTNIGFYVAGLSK
jgi:hypothetical protein